MRYLVLDLETNTETYLGRTASYLKNDIIAMGIKPQGEISESFYLAKTDIKNGFKFFDSEEFNILVIFNATFDLLYLWKYEQFQNWLKKGGKLYDPQLAEYMLSGQRHKYPSLRDLAVNKYGCKERDKKMEVYWDKKINTCDIPMELVLEDVTNDVLDTEQVMLKQVALLKKEGLFDLVMARMDGLLSTIEMEYNGIYLDKKTLEKNKKEIEEELKEIYKELEIKSKRHL